jgi:predicted nucleotidyltransferase
MSHRSLQPELPCSSKIVKTLKIFFKKRPEVLLAFLFGSFARNRTHLSSDIDIGILFKTVPEMETLHDLTEGLSSILTRDVDLAVLNYASPILKMQILKNGILVFASNKKYYYQFFTDTINQYDDLKHVRKNCEENILRGRIYA